MSGVDAYISGFPPETRAILKKIRSAIRKAAPGADEIISYRIPVDRSYRTLAGETGPRKGENQETLNSRGNRAALAYRDRRHGRQSDR